MYVPTESVEVYKTTNYWSDYADYIVGYDFEKGEVVEMSSSNEIWYTSSDGNIVTPYSGESNNNATALTTFGANIISNTYDAEKECWIIKFDGDVTSIGNYAFAQCRSLTSIVIPNSVTSIGEYVFVDCWKLTSATIGNKVTSIGEKAFYDCRRLTSVTIPDSVTSIGERAFYYCSSLTSIYCKPTTPPTVSSSAFSNNASGRNIYVPHNAVDAYKAAQHWNDYASDIVGHDF